MKKLMFLIPLILLMSLWQVASSFLPHYRFLLSSPGEIAITGAALILERSTWLDFGYTASAAIVGLLLGALLGSFAGITIVLYPNLQHAARWYLFVLGAVPILALSPMIILWCGTGWFAKVILAMLGTGLLSLQFASAGASALHGQFRNYLTPLHARRWRVVRNLLIPGALQWVLEGYRASISVAVLGVFIGEYLSSSYGIGRLILRSIGLYRMADVWCGVLLLAGLSILLFCLGNVLLRWIAPGHARLLR